MKKILYLLVFIFASSDVIASHNPDDILGVWLNGSGKGQIQIYKQNGKYYGKIIWLRDPKDPEGVLKVDKRNPKEELRTRPIVGLVILRDFKFEDDDWSGGKIYNPSDGKDYKSILKLQNAQTLSVRGYIGFSFIGKTDIWQRVK
jgi:uncharacterized protein (DUF2147 family)